MTLAKEASLNSPQGLMRNHSLCALFYREASLEADCRKRRLVFKKKGSAIACATIETSTRAGSDLS
jgi:hypothetical protein